MFNLMYHVSSELGPEQQDGKVAIILKNSL